MLNQPTLDNPRTSCFSQVLFCSSCSIKNICFNLHWSLFQMHGEGRKNFHCANVSSPTRHIPLQLILQHRQGAQMNSDAQSMPGNDKVRTGCKDDNRLQPSSQLQTSQCRLRMPQTRNGIAFFYAWKIFFDSVPSSPKKREGRQ